jgi:hypothetical protein
MLSFVYLNTCRVQVLRDLSDRAAEHDEAPQEDVEEWQQATRMFVQGLRKTQKNKECIASWESLCALDHLLKSMANVGLSWFFLQVGSPEQPCY